MYNLRCVGYARYSKDLQKENSIAYQLEAITKYCKEHNYNLMRTYKDEAQSGTNTDRQGFQELLTDASAHKFDAVVIYDVTRGSRDVGDWFSFRKMMLMLNIKVISCTQRLGDITNSNDFLIELLTVGMGQRDVLETRQKSMAGVHARAKQGVFLGGTPPLGYDIVDGKYVINENEAKTVRKIYEMYADGKSYTQIINALKGTMGKRNRPIGNNSLSSILRNERYIGVYTWNKRQVKLLRKWAGGKPNPNCVRIEDAIPKIIDKETWERVQKRMKSNRQATNKAKRQYLLTGLIKCDCCGATFVGHTSTNKKGYEYRNYVCGNKYRTHTCKVPNIHANEIEEFVITNVKEYLLHTDFEKVANEICDRLNSASKDLSKEKRELNEITTKINNGLQVLMKKPDFVEMSDEIDRLRIKKSELEDIISANEREEKQKMRPQDIVKMLENAIKNWDDDNSASAIKSLVTEIYAHIDGTYTVNIGVHSNGCGGWI